MAKRKVYTSEELNLYDKLHTEIIQQRRGTSINVLYLIKETPKYYISLNTYTYCCYMFKKIKKDFNLSVNIPVLSDNTTIDFLTEASWEDYIEENIDTNIDLRQVIIFLDKLFPCHKKVFFYYGISLTSDHCFGTLNKFNVEKPNNPDFEERDYYRLFKNKYTIDTFKNVGNHITVIPFAYTDNPVKTYQFSDSKTPYVRPNTGEIYMVITKDTVFFATERHC